MKKVIVILLCFLQFFNMQKIVFANEKEFEVGSEVYAKSAVLIDGKSGRMLIGKNPEEKMAMASTTKIMTCIIALEHCEKNQIMTVSKNALNLPMVRMNVRENEQYYMIDLLYAMMLESYNDVAVVVAENVAGSVEKFAEMMNEKANEIGMRNTHFVTPNGLDAINHYSTAYDMAIIGAYAINNKEFLKIIGTKTYSFKELRKERQISVYNKDLFLTMDNDAVGIKTGFTAKAGYCFVGATKCKDRIFVSCVLASGWPPNKSYKWHDTKMLMERGKKDYHYRRLTDNKKKIRIDIQNGDRKSITALLKGESKMMVSGKDHVSFKTIINYTLPVKRNDTVGKVLVYINGQRAGENKLISLDSAEAYDFNYCLNKIFRLFVFK